MSLFSLRVARCCARVASARGLHVSAARQSSMPVTFSSPSRVFYNAEDVRQVDVPSFSGNFGILPNHVPCLAVLRPGVVSVVENDGETKKYFVSSGTVSVNNDASVQVLAEEAVQLEELDPALCRECVTNAQSQLAAASTDHARVEAQIALEVAESLAKACGV